MVRTKADGGASSGSRKAVGGNAPRKALGGAGSSSSSASPSGSSSSKYAGGNAYCPRPTPEWQKGISMFMSPGKSKDKENEKPSNEQGTSKESDAGSSKDTNTSANDEDS